MADNSENIGGIDVTIGADYSPLADAFSSAEDLAQKAGKDIADALVAGTQEGGDAGQVLADQLAQVEPAASAAAGSLDALGESAHHTAESAHEAESGLAAMAEKMAAVGEALVITEGLREFGAEALSAADSITHASIALTTITGSGDKAEETIKGLESLGIADGLAMPSLLSAAQRMQAILGPSVDVSEELRKVADGAAVMGTDIETATAKFDMMASSGNASARIMTGLGLSLTSLATALNQVIPGSDATASSVSKMFKELDQTERIEVLNTALGTLGGTAEKVAEQTFGGQWQQLATQWEQIMAQVGQAILPVISDLITLTKTDIIPFVKELVSDFGSLPGPVKDAAVAVALVAAAVIPVTAGMGALGLAISGLQTLIPTVTGLMATLGGEAATVAVEEQAQAVATAEMGVSAAAAVPQLEALAVAETQLSLSFEENLAAAGLVGEQLSLELLPAVEATGAGMAAFTTEVGAAGLGLMAIGPVAVVAVLSAASLKDGWSQAKDTFANVAGTLQQIPGVMASVSSAGGLLGTVSHDLKIAWDAVLSAFEKYNTYSLVAKGINDITDAVDVLLGIVPGAAVMTAAMNSEQEKLQKSGEAAAAAQGKLKDSLSPLQVAIHDIVTEQDKANAEYQKALTVYNALNNSLQNGTAIYNGQTASTKEVADAYAKLQTAAGAAGVTLAPIPGSMDAITAAATKLASATRFVVSAQQEQANEQGVANAGLDLAITAYNTSVAKLDLLKAQLDDVSAAYQRGQIPRSAVITAEQNLQKAYAESQKAQKDLATTADDYATELQTGVVAGQKAALAAMQDMAAAIGPVASKFTGLDAAIEALQSQMPNFGIIVTTLSSGPLVGLQSAFDEATAKVKKFQDQMADGQNVGQQYEKALNQQLQAEIALNVAAAEVATGLQGQTDATSLATIAVAAAQAKYDTLNAAYQNNITLAPQVQAAQNALKSAQDELNTTTQQNIGLTGKLTAAYPDLASATNQATQAFDSQTASLKNNLAALNDVAAAVNSVEADMQSAFGTGSKGGGSFGGPGWRVSPGIPGVSGGSAWFTPNVTQAELQADITNGGATAQQTAATESSMNALGYNDDWSFTWPGGFTGTAEAALAHQAVSGASNGNPVVSPTVPHALGTSNGNLVLSPTPIGESGGSSDGSSGGSSSAPIATTSGGGTSAVDGGSYPAVTAHQATGEVWAVTASAGGGGGGGTVASNITTSISNTTVGGSTSGLQQLAGAVGGAVQAIDGNTANLAPIAQSLIATATATQQIATAIGGLVLHINTTGGGSGTGSYATQVGSSGTAYSVGNPTSTVGGGNPLGPYVPPASVPISNVPGYNPFGPNSAGGSSVVANVSIDMRGAMVGGAAQLQDQITRAVTNSLVNNLFASGARLTR